MQEKEKKRERVVAYIDGFNLYFGMREAGFNNCRWLNIHKLIINLLKPHQCLMGIKYFTSRVSNNPDKQKRQSTYIDALESIDIRIIYGNYQDGSTECNRCGHERGLICFAPLRGLHFMVDALRAVYASPVYATRLTFHGLRLRRFTLRG